MNIICASHQGLVRLNNEDMVAANADEGWVVLADGMGGLLAGEEASGVAVETVSGGMAHVSSESELEKLILDAHNAVVGYAASKNYVGKMGTTLMAWSWLEGKPFFCHVGDSRIYSWDMGELTQLSRDQTVAQRMIDEGLVPAHQAHNAPNQNVLTQAVGMPGKIQPERGLTPSSGRLLVCSDGLSDLVPFDLLNQLLGEQEPQTCVDELVKAALDRGGRDNISLALIELG